MQDAGAERILVAALLGGVPGPGQKAGGMMKIIILWLLLIITLNVWGYLIWSKPPLTIERIYFDITAGHGAQIILDGVGQ